jgi:hypothetical protein
MGEFDPMALVPGAKEAGGEWLVASGSVGGEPPARTAPAANGTALRNLPIFIVHVLYYKISV